MGCSAKLRSPPSHRAGHVTLKQTKRESSSRRSSLPASLTLPHTSGEWDSINEREGTRGVCSAPKPGRCRSPTFPLPFIAWQQCTCPTLHTSLPKSRRRPCSTWLVTDNSHLGAVSITPEYELGLEHRSGDFSQMD
ncbi:unnamed protein product [Protopolystoma xenopodis]|uniref:Uncharacterized protein n=1 Tax=Protopolystoma xenopodis TaxID=117903 RepID=A0A3S5CBN1_9PLAT|nr:unnamed protein product [Protopolystoma xenopodis]